MFERIFRECAKGALWALGFTGLWFIWRGAWLSVDVVAPQWLVDPTWYSFMLTSAAAAIASYYTVRFLSQ